MGSIYWKDFQITMLSKFSSKFAISALLVAAGLLAIGLGHWSMLVYEATAAKALPAPTSSANCTLRHDSWALVIAAHPNCPCTRATLNELSRLLCTSKALTKVYMLFYRPEGSDKSWNQSNLWRLAESIPNVIPLDDPGGKESAKFNATTSGEVFLYDPSGNLRFHGGITGARGHEGDNAGEDIIAETLSGRGTNSERKTPFFGCSIK